MWFLQGKGISGEIGLFKGTVVDWVWVGVGPGWSLCTPSGNATGCSLCALSRTATGCSLCTLSGTTASCSLCTLSSTTGSLGDSSFALLLLRGIGWLLIGVVSLW
jgi:hypothetical protein